MGILWKFRLKFYWQFWLHFLWQFDGTFNGNFDGNFDDNFDGDFDGNVNGIFYGNFNGNYYENIDQNVDGNFDDWLNGMALWQFRLSLVYKWNSSYDDFQSIEVECPIFLKILNPWGKVMVRSGLRLEHFCLEVV